MPKLNNSVTKILGENWYAWLLPAAVIFFLPFGSLLYVPLVIMALVGIVTFFYRKIYKICWNDPCYRFLIFAFALIWIPMFVSLTDAVNLAHSANTTISVLPYLFVGFFIIYYMDKRSVREKLSVAVLFITSFWCFDAIFQLIFGVDLFGNTYISDTRLSGIFYPRYTLGLVLAVLLPVVLEILSKLAKNRIWIILAILVISIQISVIVLSGSRNAVIMLVFDLAGWFFYTLYIRRNISWRGFILALIISIPVITVLTLQQPSRLDTLVDVPDSSLKTLDRVSNHRLPLWEAAIRMSEDHWINGIGPRGFRHIYDNYRPAEGKYNHDYAHGSTHPHFALLEIMVETGLIGLVSILILIFFLFRKMNLLADNVKLDVYPWFLGVVIAIVPNIAKAFYSTFWISIVLCMLFVGIANIKGSYSKTSRL